MDKQHLNTLYLKHEDNFSLTIKQQGILLDLLNIELRKLLENNDPIEDYTRDIKKLIELLDLVSNKQIINEISK